MSKTDMTPLEYAKQNDYATARVPQEAKMSNYAVTMMIIGLIIALSALYTGASFTDGLNLSEVLKATLVGNLILCVYGSLMAILGAREGVTITMASRHSFGRAGQGIISAIVAISLAGWFAWQCNFFGQTIHAMFPNAGAITNPTVAGVWGGIMMTITAYVGSKGLSILSNFAAPLIFIMSLVGAGIATGSVGGWSQLSILSESCKGGSVTFSVAVVAVVGAFATGGIIQPDITRFCKSAKASVIATIIGFIVAQGGVITAGYIMCVVAQSGDVATALLGILGGWSLLILIFAQWTTNDNNLYSSSLAICSLFPKFNKHKVVIVVAIVAIIAGATGVVNNFVAFLSFLGVTVPPVGGVVAADYFIMKKMNYTFGKGTRYGFVSIPAVISWIAGAAVGNFVKWGIGAINALVVAFVLYLILEQIFKSDPDKQYVGGFYIEDEYGDLSKE